VAVPKLDTEVSKLVEFASANKTDIVVRGGGHSTGGTSSTDGGLVIDLSAMRRVAVDPAAKLIVAQGGALWADVDEAAATHGLATVGGTVNHTGIGGLTLGGGFGWLSGRYGTVVDNLVSARVVVPDGRILTASETENPDLFWAIRGAGHNFGVTVEFTLRAHDQPHDVYAGALVFTPDKMNALVDALNAQMQQPDPRGAAMLVFARPPDMPAPLAIVNVFFDGGRAAAEGYFASLLALEPVAVTAETMPYCRVNGMLNALTRHGGRKALKSVIFAEKVDAALVQELWRDYTAKMEANPDLAATFIAIEFMDLSQTRSVPVEAMAFPNRGPYRAGIIGMAWTDQRGDEENRAWGRSLQAKCRRWVLDTQRDAASQSGSVMEYANYLERENPLLSFSLGTWTAHSS